MELWKFISHNGMLIDCENPVRNSWVRPNPARGQEWLCQ